MNFDPKAPQFSEEEVKEIIQNVQNKTLKFIEDLRQHKGEGGRTEEWELISFNHLIRKLKEFYKI